MIRWTTPTLSCTIPSDIVCDYVILTVKQNNVIIEKTVSSGNITNGHFDVTFTQSEMGQLVTEQYPTYAEIQLNIINNGVRSATNIIRLEIGKNLHDQAIV